MTVINFNSEIKKNEVALNKILEDYSLRILLFYSLIHSLNFIFALSSMTNEKNENVLNEP